MKLSESIKYGVCDFIVNSEISLNNLLKLVSKYSVEPKKIKNVNLKIAKPNIRQSLHLQKIYKSIMKI